jgi:diaminopimelate decarboxylase
MTRIWTFTSLLRQFLKLNVKLYIIVGVHLHTYSRKRTIDPIDFPVEEMVELLNRSQSLQFFIRTTF